MLRGTAKASSVDDVTVHLTVGAKDPSKRRGMSGCPHPSLAPPLLSGGPSLPAHSLPSPLCLLSRLCWSHASCGGRLRPTLPVWTAHRFSGAHLLCLDYSYVWQMAKLTFKKLFKFSCFRYFNDMYHKIIK